MYMYVHAHKYTIKVHTHTSHTNMYINHTVYIISMMLHSLSHSLTEYMYIHT